MDNKSKIILFNKYRKLREWGRVDSDGAYWYQCVDLIRDWVGYANLPPITNRGNANGLDTTWLGSGWKRIKNSISWIPSPWDIIFFNNPPYGHVAIVGRAWLNWVDVLEQNAGNGNGDWLWANSISFRRLNYRKVTNWYTPNDLQTKD